MPHKLLLADDSITIQRVVELTFAGEDIRVVAVADGQQAIERLQRDRPDVILADISLPKPNGYEVAAFARQQPGLARVPILLLMGAFETIDEERIAELGVSGVLVKPFEPQVLVRRVREALADAANAPGPHAVETHAVETPAPEPDAPPARVTPTVAPRPTVMQARPGPPPQQLATPPTAHGERSEARRIAEEGSSLDDYFDRLDAAFASLGHGATETPPAPTARRMEAVAPAPPPPTRPVDDASPAEEPVALVDDEWFDRTDLTSSPTPAAVPDLPLHAEEDRPASAVRASVAAPEPALRPAPPAPVAEAPCVEVPAPRRLIAPPPASTPSAVPGEPSGPATPPVRPKMSEVFGAFLAQEQGRSVAIPMIAGAIPDAVIDEIVERALARLSDALTRRIVPDIVSETAERLVREEIDRMRGRA